ncbi:MAG: hypothetical protein KGD63_02850 [Candidatus Lokiarchaeota archaeon]|nr:hypothetical protein [Candidatus Lokiarchaeota archaeon]
MIFPIPELNKFHDDGLFSVWGSFGVGKTTFALQTAFNTIRTNKNVLFFYTKPNLPVYKIKNIFDFDEKVKIENFNIIRIKDFDELYKISFKIEYLILNFLKKNKKIDLIIIDSITDLYNLDLNINEKERNISLNYQLNQILANFAFLNKNYNIDILIINETSKKNQNDSTIEIQSGGKVMTYWIAQALKIERTSVLNERKFILTYSIEKIILEFKLNMTNNGFII